MISSFLYHTRLTMKTLTFIIALGGLLLLNSTLPESKNASITFSVSKLFWSVDGSFDKSKTSISFDPKFPERSSIKGSVQISSIQTNNAKRDKHLQQEDWFNSEKFPSIELSSISIVHLHGNTFEGKFLLAMKGKSALKTIPFTNVKENRQQKLIAVFPISLQEFSIGSGKGVDKVVGDEVTVSISLPYDLQNNPAN
jgi:polyisoprenoid-binding protein YceI